MNAIHHEFDLSQAEMLPPEEHGAEAAAVATLAARWDALHAAADAVARLAHLAPDTPTGAIASLPQRAVTAGGLRQEAVARGVEDLELVMRKGLQALLATAESGRDSTAAALTLWREFHAGRQAVCAFVEPELSPA